jgi:hypothetical protein
VLDGEQAKQGHVDGQALDQRAAAADIDRLGDHEIADETDGVKDGEEKGAVGGGAVEDREKAGHCLLLGVGAGEPAN